MPKISAIIFFIFAILVWGTVAHSQLVRQVTPESATNPKPDDNDFIIPLPCDLTMAFRPIFIPEKGYLGEFEGSFGQDPVNTEGDETNFINQKHKVYLGSALSVESLPQAYQAKAQAIKKQLGNDQADRQLYLIGKYEVTNAQYEAVVNENCKLGADSARPVASVSFYDALNFTYKLMQYLLDQAPDSLPREQQDKRNIGILRLPTEEEWEYAARGGHMVSNESLTLEDFFPMEEGKTPKNYGLYYDEISPPVRTPTNIGSFQPNPAGIYDTIGNV
ncbi:MAG: formylglycine-generating enzyme family protein, partial [Deltaproteobacteria bacterium]|nr:formylglycine-generating enzyme family protein [Deltaproteobacteria bacterium]